MSVRSARIFARHGFLRASVSGAALVLASTVVYAQGVDVGTVDAPVARPAKPAKPVKVAPARVTNSAPAAATGLPISSDQAIGSKAPLGSAPALAPSQASLNSSEPGSVISDKVIKDIIQPSSDYNETAKFTPGFYSNNTNGPLGDSKSGWRGFADGQFNITFDGVPFGDANDPSHHSAANFPGAFLGRVLIDRGPGAASQPGYATFGGTMALQSKELSDKFGGSVGGSVGNFGTYTVNTIVQSGLVGGDTRAYLAAAYNKTDGAIQLGHVDNLNFMGKLEKQMGDVTATLFSTYTRENYNNINAITWAEWQAFGKNFGQVTNNPATQQFVGYNNSAKQTDLEYVKLDGRILGFHFDHQLYTYSYWYPSNQNNGNNQAFDGVPSIANGQTINVVSITNPATGCTVMTATCKTKVTFTGIGPNDVTGFLKFNNYRSVGDIMNLSRDIDAGFASGTARLGMWAEHVDNGRFQQFYDYTTGTNYANLPSSITSAGGATAAQQAIDLANASYKLTLNSHITNYQPYMEYEWRPVSNLSITPGFKYTAITRDHDGQVNQTTLQPVSFTHTYTASLPFLAARYKVTPEITVYAQASKGFLIPTVSAYYVYNADFNNGGIAPEQTTNYQAGAVFKNNSITASFAAYQITATNFPVTTTLTTGETIYQNAGTARYQGLEAEGTYAFGKLFGDWSEGLAAYASGSISNAKFIAGPMSGLYVPNAPNYTLAGGLIYDNGMFFGSLLHKITGDQYGGSGQQPLAGGIDTTLNHVGAYNSTDFVLGVRSDFIKKTLGWGEKAEFKIGVTDIFDNRAITDIGGKPGSMDPSTAGLTYSFQAGRIIYAGLKVDF